MNLTGCLTLFRKEIRRFTKVWLQTVGAPVLSALLYQMIFSHALNGRSEALPGLSYQNFLIPGLIMMGMTQNAFANVSSSLIQSRLTGNLVYILLPPLSSADLFAAYTGAAVVRGLLVGISILLSTALFTQTLPLPQHPWLVIYFALSACLFMSAIGLIAGIVSEKFDQLAAFQNFFILPLTFLSGVFYSIRNLPPFWQQASHANPVFYLIDGFRYSFFGQSDSNPHTAVLLSATFTVTAAAAAFLMLRSGYKLRDR